MSIKSALISLTLLAGAVPAVAGAGEPQPISRELLVSDIRQLAQILESAHPDPYINGGGKVAFHKRMHDLIASLPEAGLTQHEFYVHLLPFVAALEDSHTRLHAPPTGKYKPHSPGGIPLYFEPIERSLCVYGVQTEEERALLGAQLVSVEGVSFDDLVNRQKRLMGGRNDYFFLQQLAGTGTLWRGDLLRILVPEWTDHSRIRVALRHPSGVIEDRTISIPALVHYDFHTPGSKIDLPPRERSHIVPEFLDENRKVALLIIDNMVTYRENFEMARAQGTKFYLDMMDDVYSDLFKTAPPDDIDEAIASLPSATDIFRALAEDMKKAETRQLVIDLRRNGGGNSLLTDILVFFLYGKAQILPLHDSGFSAIRYSPLYFQQHENVSLEDVNDNRSFPLVVGDYGLSTDVPAMDAAAERERVRGELDKAFSQMPTFYAAYSTGSGSGLYRPPQIAVLCSTHTYSSGFTMMEKLHELGPVLVGAPSSQDVGGFGAVLDFKLDRSGLTGWVSYAYYGDLLYDPEQGRAHMPDYLLTYQKAKEYEFDTNSALLYALELLEVEVPGGA